MHFLIDTFSNKLLFSERSHIEVITLLIMTLRYRLMYTANLDVGLNSFDDLDYITKAGFFYFIFSRKIYVKLLIYSYGILW